MDLVYGGARGRERDANRSPLNLNWFRSFDKITFSTIVRRIPIFFGLKKTSSNSVISFFFFFTCLYEIDFSFTLIEEIYNDN